MKALYLQLEEELKLFHATNESIETLFIGGGTPSTIPPELYEPIFALLASYLACGCEITSEANPNSATVAWLSGMWNLGVNRISFGVQSFDDTKLKLLNRAHSSQQAKEAILNAQKVGFVNISLDLIYATFGDTKELLAHDLKTAFSLPINHISAYALTIEEKTPFENKPQMSKESLKLTSWLFKEITKNEFTQYEISNFGTYQSSHNLGYWLYEDYMGVGSGAVGKKGNERYYPHAEIEKYIQNPLEKRVEILTQEDIKIEQLFLGFRSRVGVKKELLTKEEQQRAEILLSEKKLRFEDGIFYNINYLLADEIALYLCS